MDKKQAKRLGAFLKRYRQAKGWSTYQLAEASGQTQATVVRYEQGEFANPSPERLRRLAEALDVPAGDVLALADYLPPETLLSVGPYLRAKYRDLSDDDIAALNRDVERVLNRHGLHGNAGPAPGEDEQPEPPTKTGRARTTKKGRPV